MNPITIKHNVLLITGNIQQRQSIKYYLNIMKSVHLDCSSGLHEGYEKLTLHIGHFDTLIVNFDEVHSIDFAEWLVDARFRQTLILLGGESKQASFKLPCKKVVNLPVKVSLNNLMQIFCKRHSICNQINNSRDFLKALLARKDAIKLEFQPQFNVADESLYGFEVTSQFFDRGARLPTRETIYAIEEKGLMAQFAEVFFTQLSHCLMAFKEYRISINLSLCHMERYDISQLVYRALSKAHLKSLQLTLEIGCRSFFSASPAAVNALCKLKSEGYSLCLEHYDLPFSELTNIPLLVDGIKFSGLISELSPKQQKFLHQHLSPLAKSSNVNLIFSEIEKHSQLQNVATINDSALVQGFFLAPPMSYQQAVAFIGEEYKQVI